MSSEEKTNWFRFWESGGKVTLISLFMFLPLLINIIYTSITHLEDPFPAIKQILVPGEMFAYSFSLIAPMFIMYMQTHGTKFSLPGGKPIFIIAFIHYVLTLLIVVAVKNNWHVILPCDPKALGQYLWISIIFLGIAIAIRLYVDFHEGRFKDLKVTSEKEQMDFNQGLNDRINELNG